MDSIYIHPKWNIDCVMGEDYCFHSPLKQEVCDYFPKVIHDTIAVSADKVQGDILSRLNDLYVDGTGYNDVVGIIAFPLIIALFAFSFPFVFDRINQINNKYRSKNLSQLFRSSCLYRLFWNVSFVCIVYVLFYGACALFFKDSVLVKYSALWNSVSLFVAISYVLIVWLFAKSTVRYNNPEQLLDILNKQYKREQRRLKIDPLYIKAKACFRFFAHRKDGNSNSIYNSARRMVAYWKKDVPEHNFINRLGDIARYAVKQDDFELFKNVLIRIDDIVKREKYIIYSNTDVMNVIQEGPTHRLTMIFFMDLMLDFSPFSRGYMSNETVVFKMVGTFNRSVYLSFGDSMYLAACLRRMIDKDNETLVYKYVDYTSYYFKYILRLPQVYYIKGGLLSNRNNVEKTSYESWKYLAMCHYAALAYGFDKEKYYILDIHLNNRDDEYNLYPRTGIEVLVRYAQCLKHSCFLKNDLLSDKNTDINVEHLLARYTSLLVMLLAGQENSVYLVASHVIPEYIGIIEQKRKKLIREAEFIKQNKHLLDLYPRIKDVNIDSKLNGCIQRLKTINDSSVLLNEQNNNERKDSRCFLTNILDFFKKVSAVKVRKPNLYRVPLDSSILENFKNSLLQFNSDVARHIPKCLLAEKVQNKDQKIDVKPCQLLIHKSLFIDTNVYNCYVNNIYHEFVELISNRIIYLTLYAFHEMKIHKESLISPSFDAYFDKFTHGKNENYVLIGVESPFYSILDIRFKGNEQYYRQVVPYISIDAVGGKNLLTDLEYYDFFKDSLLIVAKSDLPAIEDYSDGNINVNFHEESDESKMEMNVRTTIDIHKKVVFNKNVEIAMVKIKQMSV